MQVKEMNAKVRKLQANKQFEQANQLLIQALEIDPKSGETNYLLAANCDMQGEESAAVPYYVKAMELGLNDQDLRGAYLGLGSTYRTLGQYKESQAVFAEGLSRFPAYEPLHVFYSLTLYNLGDHEQAMNRLLTTLLRTTSDQDIHTFGKALEFYSTRLNQVWT